MNQEVPTLWAKIAVAAAGLAVFALVTWLADSDLGAAIAFGFAAVTTAAYARWDLHRNKYYWSALAVMTAVHVAVLTRFHATIPSPAIQVAPLVIVDFIAMVMILSGLAHLLGDRRA